jgi:arsenite methyltransferase
VFAEAAVGDDAEMTVRISGQTPHGAAGQTKATYGIDGCAITLPVIASLQAVPAAMTVWALRRERRSLGALAGAAWLAATVATGSYLYSTLRGKFLVWAQLLDDLHLHGDEDLLDVGCGRGAVLLAAARRLPEGHAVGVDLWRRRDQTGNTRTAAERNAVAEGVADRVEFLDADARALPLPDASFDVVVSSLTLHNIAETDQRAQALREVARVLRPGGRLRIVDVRAGRRYPDVLRAAGCADITVQPLDWRVWFGTPGDPLVLVTANKPH